MTKDRSDRPQIDKFKEAARELETDDREEAFDEKLRKIGRSPPPDKRKGLDSKD